MLKIVAICFFVVLVTLIAFALLRRNGYDPLGRLGAPMASPAPAADSGATA